MPSAGRKRTVPGRLAGRKPLGAAGRGGLLCAAAPAPGPPLPTSGLTLLLGACHSSPAAHTDFQTLLSVHGAQLASQTGPGETGASGQPEAPAGGTALAQALGERLLTSSSCRLAEAVRG